jgi:hypothetical protein
VRVPFQEIDTKSGCFQYYLDDFCESLPKDIKYITWKEHHDSNSLDVEFSWLKTGGLSLDTFCDKTILENWRHHRQLLYAHFRAFRKARVAQDENCFFDLVPRSLLKKVYEAKNALTSSVWENTPTPGAYDILKKAHLLTEEMSEHRVEIDQRWLRENRMFSKAGKLKGEFCHRISYNIFGTKTGRFTTTKDSFPILTLSKFARQAIIPKNDLFVSFDYNAAEIRVLLALLGLEQPSGDLHDLHAVALQVPRDQAKISLFSWLYSPAKKDTYYDNLYDKKQLLSQYYNDGVINTDYGRKIEVEEKKAFNYLLQSTTNDMAIEGFYKVVDTLKTKKTKIAFMIHDSLVLDVSREDASLLSEIKSLIESTRYGTMKCSMGAGRNLGQMENLI